MHTYPWEGGRGQPCTHCLGREGGGGNHAHIEGGQQLGRWAEGDLGECVVGVVRIAQGIIMGVGISCGISDCRGKPQPILVMAPLS
jgi:hypothetical protein